MFRRISRGIGKGIKSLTESDAPKPPAVTEARGGLQLGEGGRQRRSFQDRFAIDRVGVQQSEGGPSELELRAEQGIEGTLAERILYKELRRRDEEFFFHTGADGGLLTVAGVPVDFLVTSREPNIALDVLSDWSATPWGPAWRDMEKQVRLAGQGIPYEVLWDEVDIYPSAAALETRIDLILGRVVTQLLIPNGNPFGSSGGGGGSPSLEEEEADVTLQRRIEALEQQLGEARHDVDNHGSRHASSQYDAPLVVPRAERIVRLMKNRGSGTVIMGTPVTMFASEDNSFTNFTAAEDVEGIIGVTDEDIPQNGVGGVVISGFAEVRVTGDGTGVVAKPGYYLRTSEQASENAEVTIVPTGGTFGICLGSRNTTTGRVLAFIGLSPNYIARQSITSNVDVTNSTAETNLVSYGVTANTLLTNRRLRLRLFGDILNNTAADASFTVILRFGTGSTPTAVVNSNTITIATSANRRAFCIEVEVAADGATNTQVALLALAVSFPSTASNGVGGDIDVDKVFINTAGEDTTAATTCKVAVQWAAASSNLSFRLLSAEIEML